MRIRTAALVGGWAVALVAATTVSWAGVNLVGNEVSPYGATPLSQAEVERRIQAAASSPVGTTPVISATPGSDSTPVTGSATPGAGTASGSGSTPAGTPVQRSVVAQGGTVVLTCTGEQANARSSPRSGYAASEHSRSQGATVRIIFSDGSHRSQIDGACPGGMPTMSVLEAAQIGDD